MPFERCSFCGVSSTPAVPLVRGPGDVAICGGCAELAVALLDENDADVSPDLVVHGISTLVTMDSRRGDSRRGDSRRGDSRRGDSSGADSHAERLLGIEYDVVVAVRRGRVVWIGAGDELPAAYRDLPRLDCEGRAVLPGLVDAAAPLMGDPPVGRPDPVELTEATAGMVRRMLARGITGLDLRLGGGTEPTVETLLLAVARAVGDRMSTTLSISWRCAPDLPSALLDEVMAPTAARLAGFVVVECQGDRSELERMVASTRGMQVRLRCCEDEPDACREVLGSAVTIETPPASKGASKGATMGAVTGAHGPTPLVPWWEAERAVQAWEAGARPALATYSDPGTMALEGMGVVLMAATEAGLGLDRALWSVTRAGALAVGDGERGWLHLGGPADLVVVDGAHPSELVRRPDGEVAWRVVVGGVEVV